MIPPGLLFALGLLSSWLTGGARFSQNGHLQRKAQLPNSPESFAFTVLPSQQAIFTPVFPGCPPRTAVRFDPDSYGDLALPWDPVHVKVCVHLLRMGSLFPPVLWSSCAQSPTGLQCQMLWGLFLPLPDTHTWEFDVGLRTLTPVCESL